MPMPGYDSEFRDLPDYIIRITERIWQGRGIHLIRRWYTDDCVVRVPLGVSRTVQDVVRGTLETLHQFPDRRLLPEDVVWSGDAASGFYSSHRIVSNQTHLGGGMFGPPTGRPILTRGIADCAVKENRIYEEWLVRDNGSIARQVGIEPRDLAAALVARDRAAGRTPDVYRGGDPTAVPHAVQDHPAAALYAGALRRLWTDKDVSAVRSAWHDAAQVYLPGGLQVFGHDPVERFWFGWLAAFADAELTVEHLIALEEPGRPVRVAARWRAVGTHCGHGAFGPPTGAPIHVMGISQAHVVDGRVVAEWVLMDEIAVWKQVVAAEG